MNTLLTKEQIKDIRHMQKNLDIKVREANDIDMDKDLSLEKYIALKTELFEFANEVEAFKYWKKNKGKAHILEEACDTLHFIFSLAIDMNVEINQEGIINDKYNADDYDMNEVIGIMDAMISDCYIEKEWDALNGVLAFLCIALDKCGFNADDIYKAYVDKNKENHKRQDNNY